MEELNFFSPNSTEFPAGLKSSKNSDKSPKRIGGKKLFYENTLPNFHKAGQNIEVCPFIFIKNTSNQCNL
jgi:hypothetical protein